MPQKTQREQRISRTTFLNILSEISGMFACAKITENQKNQLSQIARSCLSENSWDALLDYCGQEGLTDLQEVILLA